MVIHSIIEWQFLTSIVNGLLFIDIHFSQSGLTILYVVFFFLNSWFINLNVSFWASCHNEVGEQGWAVTLHKGLSAAEGIEGE